MPSRRPPEGLSGRSQGANLAAPDRLGSKVAPWDRPDRAAPGGRDGTAGSRVKDRQTVQPKAAERCRRQAQHIAHLEKHLSDVLGESVWRETGLSAPPDIDALQRGNTRLQREATDLRQQLADRQDNRNAARGATGIDGPAQPNGCDLPSRATISDN